VVWFGENLDEDILGEAYTAAATCEVMLVIGTSAVVQPSASFPVEARARGALVADINIETTPLSSLADISLPGKAGDIVPKFLDYWH
jgi:NAD-dependent deacetylase